jgi:hypothetical protein
VYNPATVAGEAVTVTETWAGGVSVEGLTAQVGRLVVTCVEVTVQLNATAANGATAALDG